MSNLSNLQIDLCYAAIELNDPYGTNVEVVEELAQNFNIPISFVEQALENNPLVDADYDDSMDGDFDSAMASAGYGTDEDYGYYGDDY